LLPVGTPPQSEVVQPKTPETPSLNILVIDDEEAVRNVLVRMLQRLGHQVDSAGSGESALSQFVAGRYDLVCTDLGMPGMSGWEVAAQVRRVDPAARVVLVTGWSEQIDPDEARGRGIDAILAKPFTIQQVRSLLASILLDRR
jgi:CheY-like chemotaxis protein